VLGISVDATFVYLSCPWIKVHNRDDQDEGVLAFGITLPIAATV
jgi:hypothetical protein